MLDSLLKSKFYSKCKSDIKLIRTRIEMIKRKRNAMQKYLRNDVSDLLKNGLDYNAYGRAEGLLAEMCRSQCYEIIDQYCQHILKNLSAMDKQRECPEDCREAASCLMFAAARFADLPELRELRSIFSERYGKSLDYYVNKQFEEKLKSGPPSNDMKLQLLQEIAAESGIEWDSKALENKLFSEASYNKNFAKKTTDKENSSGDPIDDSVQKKSSRGTRYGFYEQKDRSPQKMVPKEEDEDKPLKHRWITPPYTKSEANKAKENVKPIESNEDKESQGQEAKPMPKSVRTKTLKPRASPEIAGGTEGDERVKEKETNKEKAALGQRILKFFDGGGRDQQDEEEKVLDKLLQRYSKKNEAREEDKLESVLMTDSKKDGKHRSRDNPGRMLSLPAESSGLMQKNKTHTRAASFHPDGKAHVHPKMPEYDDFVARLAAYRGK